MKNPPRDSSSRVSTFLERRGWSLALLITAAGFFARLPGIFGWWLNPDEGIYFSMITWVDAASFWAEMAGNANPPLFYLVIRALGLLTRDFAAIRALSLACGTVAIYAAWLAGREIASTERSRNFTGLCCAALVAASPGAILMSQIIRPYMMQLAFLVFALYHILRFHRESRTVNLTLYSVFLSLALLTHYASMLAFGVFGIFILSDFIVGRFGFRDLPRLLAANAPPVLICLGLYVFHLRPHMVGSAIAEEALDGWLAPFMIDSIGDIWYQLLGFMGLLLGPRLVGLGFLLLVGSLALAAKMRSRALLVLSLAAFGIAITVAAAGYYPFGCTRHNTWLIAFSILPLAWGLAQIENAVRPARRPVAVTLLFALLVTAPLTNRLVGATRVQTRIMKEQVLRTSDFARIQPLLESTSEPGILMMGLQTYSLLLPLFVNDREAAEPSPDGSFFHFQWGSREVIVLDSWVFSARPGDIGKPNHLYSFVLRVDQQMPHLQLGKQNEVLFLIGGWSFETSQLLLQADQSLPANARLITSHHQVPGLTALFMDIGRYRLVMMEALRQKTR